MVRSDERGAMRLVMMEMKPVRARRRTETDEETR
jgi:hypothetical protein